MTPEPAGRYAAKAISKEFGGVTVLDQVDFEIRAGEVHALLGENGSGKSTLIRVLGGVHRPSAGEVLVDGERKAVGSPVQAGKLGLGIVHQDLNLFPDLDIASNIAIASGPPVRTVSRTVDRHRTYDQAEEILGRLGLQVDPRMTLRELGIAEWKLVEIGRTLLSDVRFLILDEPTALLDRRDSRTVLDTVARLRDEGLGVALVTHRLDEALQLANRFTVLRDGRVVTVLESGATEASDLVQNIVGTSQAGQSSVPVTYEGERETAIELRGVELNQDSDAFDLEIRRGEIVGLTGLVGSGALELARALGGRSRFPGTVHVAGREISLRSPADAIRAGIGYIPEDRKEAGIVECLSVEENLCMASLEAVTPHGLLRRRLMRRRAERLVDELGIRTASPAAPIASLSGGNQQKVQIGKWLSSDRRVLVVESPTHGVDVGAKTEIHRLLREFAAGGGAVIVASTDIPDVLAVADRVVVFRNGAIVSLVEGTDSSHRDLLLSGAQDTTLDEIEELMEI